MFLTINNDTNAEIVEKKSKFIANVFYVSSKEEAENKIKEIKKTYFDSRHNCSSYRVIENGSIIEKSNDDGEPSGTAGAPMLNILKKNNLCNILVVVTRYFGGILLGTGGLVRAYSEATIKALEKAEKVEITEGKEIIVRIEYSNFENLKYYCKKNKINIVKTEYLDEIECSIEIKNEDILKFKKDLEQSILEVKEVENKYIKI